MKKRFHAKIEKQDYNLHRLKSNELSVLCGNNFPLSYLKEKVVVFDGGILRETAPSVNSDTPNWCCHKIKDGVLRVCHPPSSKKGLIFKDDNDVHPRFILFPREDALAINMDGRKHICPPRQIFLRGRVKW